ncbi:hypothetical protein [Pseudoxanthomonas sp. CF125]|uniref:hypothetical protein n=1 Tax=Pseudoxanthomonas sp. CF125 TaxID=1855303 RepID=UPI000883830E|nr:hypothetical protein [Pseudoxanthomonas sp. CF125]SDQ84246.1 hypothetical protein SAMN05216569_2267 [Pseudoxanthomonas sp. CF125]
MKLFAALLISSFVLGSSAAMACGTHPPAVQSKIDATELAELRALASAAARDADQIVKNGVRVRFPKKGTLPPFL